MNAEKTFRIPPPPRHLFTEGEWARMQARGEARAKAGTTVVNFDTQMPEQDWAVLYADHTA